MGQKVNPHGLRVGVISDWDSRWFENDKTFGDTLVSDYKVRKYLKEKLYDAGIPKIEIERTAQNVKVIIHCAKPGMVIGRAGSEIDKLRSEIEKMVGKKVSVDVKEIKSPDLDAQLVAESIAAQIEKRIAFRRAMKQAISRTRRLGAKGIKLTAGGRLNGAEIARSETYHEGTIPLQTIRADIDYGFAEAKTTYGRIGIKCWIYKGEILAEKMAKGYVPGERNNNRRNGKGGDRRNNNGEHRNQNHAGGKNFNNGERRNNNGDHRNNANRGPRKPREAGAENVNA
ncbi:MAG: 30S ribosomal protein S3 [Clostridiales bacterium]|nr:30S ribosomal protein S3 [Clostridiales bacterium]